MPSLNVIGAGKVGATLASLFFKAQVFSVNCVVASSLDSAKAAVATIGAGNAVVDYASITAADYVLIATPDNFIKQSCDYLAFQKAIKPGSVVFHVSGAVGTDVLATAVNCGATVASVHPLKSFADVDTSIATFSGTPCAITATDENTLTALKTAFAAIGAIIFNLKEENKILYHASAVIACNYLTTVMQAAVDSLKNCGFSSQQALQLLQPICQQTLENNFTLGPQKALTGPIARGDSEVVAMHQQQLQPHPSLLELYNALAKYTVEITNRN